MPTLFIPASTWIKKRPIQAADLPAEEKAWIVSGRYEILAYRDGDDSHSLVTFDPNKVDLHSIHPSGHNTWYVWMPHCRIDGNLPNNQPDDKPSKPTGKVVNIAGLGQRGLGDPVDGCQHFTWGEMTHGGTRLPESPAISKNIVKVSKVLEEVRVKFGGNPITITSGYRPPAINAAVGGASQSRHLVGDAVDFSVAGYSPSTVYQRLDAWWGARGGLASGNGFTHIDCRGYRARWTY